MAHHPLAQGDGHPGETGGWQPIATAPNGVVVMTKIDDADGGIRNEQELKLRGGLWFFPDDSMYVYYKPTHWKPV